ncbi:MAG: hypothetical protein JO042_12495 [Sinobacteraceae bacterium]|nr:hypothetical protein [Nevskiaceae bacterium]
MSPRDWFWFVAGVLVTLAIMLIARAWLSERPAQTVRQAIPAFAVPVAAALALIGVALGIYFLLGSPSSITSAHASGGDSSMPAADANPSAGQTPTNAGSLDDVTQKLATRLATQGGSDSDWNLLAESYEYMGRTADAKAARAHIASPAASDTGAGGQPGGATALDSQTMAAVADALDTTGKGTGSPNPGVSAEISGARTQISGTVELATKLAARAAAGATLFIYAKQPNTPGPPLAVVRLPADHWPVSFTLTDANAMVPGRNLSSAQTVQVEARISNSGQALPQSGDLVGSVTSVNPREGQPVKISIDRPIG